RRPVPSPVGARGAGGGLAGRVAGGGVAGPSGRRGTAGAPVGAPDAVASPDPPRRPDEGDGVSSGAAVRSVIGGPTGGMAAPVRGSVRRAARRGSAPRASSA